jgi:glucokinase
VAGLKWLPYGGMHLITLSQHSHVLTGRDSLCLCLCIPGLYITGGLTPKNIDLLRDPAGPFMAAFKDKVSGL